jgi:hypothetical protein
MFISHTALQALQHAETLNRCEIHLESALCTPTVYFHLCYEEQIARRRILDVQSLSSGTFFAVFLRRFKKKKKSDRTEDAPSPLLMFLQEEWESRGRMTMEEAEERFSLARRLRSTAIPAQQKRGRDADTTQQRHTQRLAQKPDDTTHRHSRRRGDDDDENDDDDD